MINRMLCMGLVAISASMAMSTAYADADADEADYNPFLDRPALFDGIGTTRQSLREAGVDIQASWTQFFQGVQGGQQNDWESGGKGDIVINLDGEKLGLWPGFSINIHQEFVAGNDLNAIDNGSIVPVNTSLAFPTLGGVQTDTSILISQQFGDIFSLSLGKFNMLDAASRAPLIGGGGNNTFMNVGLAAPISGVTPPYIVGASLGINTQPVSFSLLVYDPRNAQDWDVLSNPFTAGVTVSLSSTLKTEIAGLPGFYSLRGVISTDEDIDLRDVPQLLLPPGSPTTVGTKSDPWFINLSAQQYLWQNPDDAGKGWGVFGQLGLSDGNPTPVQSSLIFGVGGNSMIAGRSDDLWGLAYFRYDLSDDLLDALAMPPVNLDLEPEEGVEAYYNFAVTPWFRVTANLQWIDDFSGSGDDAWFTGIRIQSKL